MTEEMPYSQAKSLLEDFLLKFPNDPVVRRHYLQLAKANADFDQIERHEGVLGTPAGSPSPWRWGVLGLLLVLLGTQIIGLIYDLKPAGKSPSQAGWRWPGWLRRVLTTFCRSRFVLVAFALLIMGPGVSWGLEQMNNASFTLSAGDWAFVVDPEPKKMDLFVGRTPLAAAGYGTGGSIGSQISESAQAYAYGAKNMGAAMTNAAILTGEQVFPAAGLLASPTNLEVRVSYKKRVAFTKNKDGSGASQAATLWSIDLSGAIFSSSGSQVGTPFVSEYETGGPAIDTAWTRTATWSVGLAANASYTCRLTWLLGMNDPVEDAHVMAWFDHVYVNMSPGGLMASETTGGTASLTWNPSTCPANVPQLAAANGYRIYRSPTSGGPWTQIGTSTTAVFNDPTPGDVAYYCIKDVDRVGQDSPYSPEAVFKRAKLVINEVRSPYSTVTKGQSGVPVEVVITNTGISPCWLEGASLTFTIPAVGQYTWVRTAPAFPRFLAGGESVIATFQIDVLASSVASVDVVDATASGTSAITPTLKPADAGADTPLPWLIREPAELRVLSVTVPALVHLGQTAVPVDVLVENAGSDNAAAYLDSIDLQFDLGTYLNLQLQTPLPVILYADQATSVRVLLEVSPDSATGVANIDAWIGYRDINLQMPSMNTDGALIPGQWTIVAGFMTIFKDAERMIPKTSFNQGNYTVFARAQNLTPDREHRMRWFDPTGTEVWFSNPAITTDPVNGDFDDEFSLGPGSMLGTWRVIGTRVFDSVPLCETFFTVGNPANISVAMTLPPTMSLGSTFTATMTLTNIGSATLLDAHPGSITFLLGGPGQAAYLSGPTPPLQDIFGETTATFSFTWRADNTGQIQLRGAGYGFDDNATTTPLVIGATQSSNICLIQTPPILTVASLSENYNTVSRGQEGIPVYMGIRNTGEADAIIQAASLGFNLAGLSEVVSSPSAFPFTLPGGGGIATIVFLVDVATNSATGLMTASGSYRALDANDPTSVFGIRGGVATWTILAITGKLSANAGFTPPQYQFNIGQRVYAEFDGCQIPNKKYHICAYDDIFAPETLAAAVATSGELIEPDAIRNFSFDSALGGVGQWRVDIFDGGGGGSIQTPAVGRVYFELQNPGSLTSQLTLSPTTVALGATVTVSLMVSNLVPNGSTLYPTIPSTPAETAGSVGDLTWISGPVPASATLLPGFPATFTWSYRADVNSGLPPGSYSMSAVATGTDNNDQVATTSKLAVSNSIFIVERSLALSSATIDFGTMAIESTKTVQQSRIDLTGNAALYNVTWQPSHLVGTAGLFIHRDYIAFSPAGPLSIATGGSRLASFTLTIPVNQASGPYSCEMTVFDDSFPTNGARDAVEAFDKFLVNVTVPECKIIHVFEDLVDLGNWPQGQTTASISVLAFNAGNINLTKLKFRQVSVTPAWSSTIFVTPADPGLLATDGSLLASFSCIIAPAEGSGVFLATWTLFEDDNDSGAWENPEASDTLQIRISIGDSSLVVASDPLDLGNGTPTYSISGIENLVTNTGSLNLTKLKLFSRDLIGPGGATILGENLIGTFPTLIGPGQSKNATFSLYVAAGIPVGVYTASQTIFEDLDGDGSYLGDNAEATCTFDLTVTVNPYRAVQVQAGTVSLGYREPGEVGTISFQIKNIGSLDLNNLSWESVILTSGPDTFNSYVFSPVPLFNLPIGGILAASATVSVPVLQPIGNYTGQYSWLFDDLPVDGRDPADPNSKFTVTCSVGSKSIDIVDPILRIAGGTPSQVTATVSYTIENTGGLILAKPMATVTAALANGLGDFIPATASIFIPSVFGYMNPGQTKTGFWKVSIPAQKPPGSYTGKMWVWNDQNDNGLLEDSEASSSCDIEVEVLPKRVIRVAQDPLDLFTVPAGQTGTGVIEVFNDGNIDLVGESIRTVKAQLNPIAPGPPAIPAANITFILDPITSNLNQGASVLATVTVSIPAGQTNLPYSGVQTLYVDYNGANLAFDNPPEEFDQFTLKVTVGKKGLSVNSPLTLGTRNPGATYSVPFNVVNTTGISISRGSWMTETDLNNGTTLLPPANLEFLPAIFSIGPSGTKACTASFTLDPTQPPGDYVGTYTVFEDENANAVVDGFEASSTFQVRLTVATFPILAIDEISLDAGNVVPGDRTASVSITYRNAGNATFSNLAWFRENLLKAPDFLPSGDVAFDPAGPVGQLNPGESSTADISVGPIAAGTPNGSYLGRIGVYDSVRLAEGYLLSSDTCLLTVTVIPPLVGPKIGSGTLFQPVATTTFPAVPAAAGRYILSAWVCPGSGAARIGLFETDVDQDPVNFDYVQVASNGTVTTSGGHVIQGGVTEAFQTEIPGFPGQTFTWYRIFVALDYAFDESLASNSYVVLENSSPLDASYSVWLDGLQVETAAFPDQTRPTAFGRGKKLVSPNPALDTKGNRRYYEW